MDISFLCISFTDLYSYTHLLPELWRPTDGPCGACFSFWIEGGQRSTQEAQEKKDGLKSVRMSVSTRCWQSPNCQSEERFSEPPSLTSFIFYWLKEKSLPFSALLLLQQVLAFLFGLLKHHLLPFPRRSASFLNGLWILSWKEPSWILQPDFALKSPEE